MAHYLNGITFLIDCSFGEISNLEEVRDRFVSDVAAYNNMPVVVVVVGAVVVVVVVHFVAVEERKEKKYTLGSRILTVTFQALLQITLTIKNWSSKALHF